MMMAFRSNESKDIIMHSLRRLLVTARVVLKSSCLYRTEIEHFILQASDSIVSSLFLNISLAADMHFEIYSITVSSL
jgi:hypothetical protein